MVDLIQLYEDALRAFTLAIYAHSEQVDKQGKPYLMHILRVSKEASDSFDSIPECIQAQTIGLLHDIIEDTNFSEDELNEIFSKNIVDAVVLLTKRENTPYLNYIDTILNSGNELAIAVKRADLNDNFGRLSPEIDGYERMHKKYTEALLRFEN